MLSSTTEEKTSQTQNWKWNFLIYFIFFLIYFNSSTV